MITQESLKLDIDTIAARDSQVAQALAEVGYPAPRIAPGGFPALMSIIVNQQISKTAAAAILGRLNTLMPEPTAENYLALDIEAVGKAGLSRPKIRYMQGIAEAIVGGEVDPDRFPDMTDADVVSALVALKGIGFWSAEVYCMFSLGRRDMFPGEDVALQEAMRRLKGMEERPSAKQARTLAEDWSPCRTAMSIFLWHYYHGIPV